MKKQKLTRSLLLTILVVAAMVALSGFLSHWSWAVTGTAALIGLTVILCGAAPMKQYGTKMLVTLGMLVAIEIVLSRFCSISAWNIKIGFSFVPVVVAAVLYGAVPAAVVAALGDFVGAILFPIGPYFPGFTLTAALTGTVFGLFLHRRQTLGRIGGAVAVNQLFLSLLLNTLWISVLYGAPYGPLFLTRIVQTVVLISVQFVVIGVMTKVLGGYGKRAVL